MREKIVFPKDVEISKFYQVPHVMCYDFYDGIKNVLLPINTVLHEDKDYINFEPLHYHIDWRFVPIRLYNRICKDIDLADYFIRSEASKIIQLFGNNLEANTDGKVYYKTIKCKRGYSNNQFHFRFPNAYNGWPAKLQSAFCGEQLRLNERGQYVCPHKGAIIDLKHVDEKGYAVCPAHLLRFNTETLKAI